MFSILLISTGELSEVLRAYSEELLGKNSRVRSIELNRSDQWEQAREKIAEMIAEMELDGGVLVLTDVTGGTPYNVARTLRKTDRNIELIGGVNVPMLLKAVEISKNEPLERAVQFLERYGRQHLEGCSEDHGDRVDE